MFGTLGRTRFGVAGAVGMAMLVMAACGGGSPSTGASPTTPTARPSSSATIEFISPTNGDVVRSDRVKVKLSLQGARIVPQTTTNIRPDEGHIHLLVDGTIVSMNYGLEDTIGVKPGQHVLRAEFVAADHRPFDPRVFTEVVFEVKG
jgi:hypothetical protein